MGNVNAAVTYDNIDHIHSDEIGTFLVERHKVTEGLFGEIHSIRRNLKKLISDKEAVISSLMSDERVYVTQTINELTSSFEELDSLIEKLQSITNSYDNELSKYLSLVNDTGNIEQHESDELISHEKEVITCPHCSISFTATSNSVICPSCNRHL